MLLDFHLPDGRVLKLGVERFLVPELLIDPSPLSKYDCMECGLAIQSAADKAGADIRQELFTNILLVSMSPMPVIFCWPLEFLHTEANFLSLCQYFQQAGGNSTYPGMADRVHNEVMALNSAKARIKVIAQPEADRRMSAWLGGSILGSLSSFHEMWMSKAVRALRGLYLPSFLHLLSASLCTPTSIFKSVSRCPRWLGSNWWWMQEYAEHGASLVDRKCP